MTLQEREQGGRLDVKARAQVWLKGESSSPTTHTSFQSTAQRR